MERTPAGFADLVQQTDAVGMGVLVFLLLMSAASWTVVFIKAWRNARGHARAIRSLEAFWQAPSLQQAVNALGAVARDDPFAALAQSAERAQRHYHRQEQRALGARLDFGEFVTRQLRAAIARATARLEWGQTLLASVGSTAPFIGLFGTVWGIYHALASIGNSGQATLDKVAGPVGEALIMTGLGLAVAIPAVLAYNAFTRQNRVVVAELDAFAHDLHAWLTTGARVERVETVPSALARPAPKGA